MSWNNIVAKAKQIAVAPEVVPVGYEVKGYFEKGDKDQKSWVAVLTGQLSDKYIFEREFVTATSIAWEGAKGKGNPRGYKTWHLPDGIYQFNLVEKKGAAADRFYGAVSDQQLDRLHEDQVKSIIDSGVELPAPPKTETAKAEEEI